MHVSDTYILGPARIAFGDGSIAYGRLAIERGKIASILPEEGPSDVTLPDGAIVAPGLIDVHTNGADECLFNRDQGNAVEVASRAYARMGAAGFVASIMTAPWESMMHAASEVAEAAHRLEESGDRIGSRCLGIHFEGPFLNPKFKRVHRGEWIIPATMDKAQEMIEACAGALVMVTMAPEAPGVEEIARMFFDQGIVNSAGHTAAHYREGMLAIGLGFRTLTHAFNAMPPLDHRDPSILVAFMQEARTTTQLICDGYHVSPPMVDLLYRTHVVCIDSVRTCRRERIELTRNLTRPRPRPWNYRSGQTRRHFGVERRLSGSGDDHRRYAGVRVGASRVEPYGLARLAFLFHRVLHGEFPAVAVEIVKPQRQMRRPRRFGTDLIAGIFELHA
jgi:N-acetylglucosamine-6-phosphate deacetylase